jgi:hypothetical protein
LRRVTRALLIGRFIEKSQARAERQASGLKLVRQLSQYFELRRCVYEVPQSVCVHKQNARVRERRAAACARASPKVIAVVCNNLLVFRRTLRCTHKKQATEADGISRKILRCHVPFHCKSCIASSSNLHRQSARIWPAVCSLA